MCVNQPTGSRRPEEEEFPEEAVAGGRIEGASCRLVFFVLS
jgi:hypothetical protein